MSSAIRVRADEGIAVVAFAGPCDLPEARAAIDRVLSLFAAGGAEGLLIDLAASRVLGGWSPLQVRFMALYLGLHRKRFASRLAAVVSSDEAFALARLGGETAGEYGIHVEIVRDHGAALSWLRTPR